MITSDYSLAPIKREEELEDLASIANLELSSISLDDHPNLLIFPDSFESYDRDFGKKYICVIDKEKRTLLTNSIVGFVGFNLSTLSIHSRFAAGEQDYFLHYMLQRVARINLFDLQHTRDNDSVFDFVLYLFPLYLKKALSQGLYKKYVTHKYNDANVRGVIDVGRHIRYNYPFNGRVAYSTREYDFDNDITQLIRHTIEYVASLDSGKEILSIDEETKQATYQIKEATPTYERNARQRVINRNLKPIAHPFYSEYTSLQTLCLQILRHEELKYGQDSDDIYGVLIDAAWLWEEYLAIVLSEKYNHYYKDKGPKYFLFDRRNHRQQIVPDYLSKDLRIVADAKYIPLDEEGNYGEEKAINIYYKTITYMYRFCTDLAYLFYPISDSKNLTEPMDYKIKTEIEGINGGSIIKHGLRIPSQCRDYNDFAKKMKVAEEVFLNEL